MEQVIINGQRYNERELDQIIRRKMMSKTFESKKKYNRKQKHSIKYSDCI